MKHSLWIIALAALLSACGDKPQALGTHKHDIAPYNGTGKAFVASGWQPGDKTSWASHMKARTQRGQNDYSRIN